MGNDAAGGMSHRSWYLAADAAERLAAVVDEIHHVARKPKHEVLSAAVAVAVEHQAEILARLTGTEGTL
jgi:hypothetical protein